MHCTVLNSVIFIPRERDMKSQTLSFKSRLLYDLESEFSLWGTESLLLSSVHEWSHSLYRKGIILSLHNKSFCDIFSLYRRIAKNSLLTVCIIWARKYWLKSIQVADGGFHWESLSKLIREIWALINRKDLPALSKISTHVFQSLEQPASFEYRMTQSDQVSGKGIPKSSISDVIRLGIWRGNPPKLAGMSWTVCLIWEEKGGSNQTWRSQQNW